MARKPLNISSTSVLHVATGTYFRIRQNNGSDAEFRINDPSKATAELEARVKEMRATAARWNRQADLLAAGLKFEAAKQPKKTP